MEIPSKVLSELDVQVISRDITVEKQVFTENGDIHVAMDHHGVVKTNFDIMKAIFDLVVDHIGTWNETMKRGLEEAGVLGKTEVSPESFQSYILHYLEFLVITKNLPALEAAATGTRRKIPRLTKQGGRYMSALSQTVFAWWSHTLMNAISDITPNNAHVHNGSLSGPLTTTDTRTSVGDPTETINLLEGGKVGTSRSGDRLMVDNVPFPPLVNSQPNQLPPSNCDNESSENTAILPCPSSTSSLSQKRKDESKATTIPGRNFSVENSATEPSLVGPKLRQTSTGALLSTAFVQKTPNVSGLSVARDSEINTEVPKNGAINSVGPELVDTDSKIQSDNEGILHHLSSGIRQMELPTDVHTISNYTMVTTIEEIDKITESVPVGLLLGRALSEHSEKALILLKSSEVLYGESFHYRRSGYGEPEINLSEPRIFIPGAKEISRRELLRIMDGQIEDERFPCEKSDEVLGNEAVGGGKIVREENFDAQKILFSAFRLVHGREPLQAELKKIQDEQSKKTGRGRPPNTSVSHGLKLSKRVSKGHLMASISREKSLEGGVEMPSETEMNGLELAVEVPMGDKVPRKTRAVRPKQGKRVWEDKEHKPKDVKRKKTGKNVKIGEERTSSLAVNSVEPINRQGEFEDENLDEMKNVDIDKERETAFDDDTPTDMPWLLALPCSSQAPPRFSKPKKFKPLSSFSQSPATPSGKASVKENNNDSDDVHLVGICTKNSIEVEEKRSIQKLPQESNANVSPTTKSGQDPVDKIVDKSYGFVVSVREGKAENSGGSLVHDRVENRCFPEPKKGKSSKDKAVKRPRKQKTEDVETVPKKRNVKKKYTGFEWDDGSVIRVPTRTPQALEQTIESESHSPSNKPAESSLVGPKENKGNKEIDALPAKEPVLVQEREDGDENTGTALSSEKKLGEHDGVSKTVKISGKKAARIAGNERLLFVGAQLSACRGPSLKEGMVKAKLPRRLPSKEVGETANDVDTTS